MSDLLASAVEWAASGGPPNWLFILAVLTSPARWSSTAVAIVRQRLDLGAGDVGDPQGTEEFE